MQAFFVFILVTLAIVSPAQADGVYVTVATEEIGQAWLFGSRSSTSTHCWLALPRHVVQSFDGKSLLPVRFRARVGDWGESDIPIDVASVPGAAEAAGEQDLAFAEVLVGPKPGECLGRLGLPPLAYDAALDRHDPMFIRSLVPQSFGDFAVQLAGGSSGDGAGRLLLTPTDPGDGPKFLKRGLSGAVALMTRNTGADPVGLVISVPDDQSGAHVLRFDRVRAAFDIVEASVLSARRADLAASTGVPYRIVSYSGMASGNGPASALAAGDSCWRVAPEGGKRLVQVVVELSDPASIIRGLTVAQAPGCGEAPSDVYIEQRVSADADWSRFAQCTTTTETRDSPACNLDLRGPRQLRIGIRAKTEIGLSRLSIY